MSAAALRAAAAAKDDLADRIDIEARGLPDLLDPVLARLGPDVWRGPAADAFGAAAQRWRATVESEASVLTGVARRLRLRAEDLRAQARRIEEAEAAAAAEAAAEAARLAQLPPDQRRAHARLR